MKQIFPRLVSDSSVYTSGLSKASGLFDIIFIWGLIISEPPLYSADFDKLFDLQPKHMPSYHTEIQH